MLEEVDRVVIVMYSMVLGNESTTAVFATDADRSSYDQRASQGQLGYSWTCHRVSVLKAGPQHAFDRDLMEFEIDWDA